jgi:hypothetical protein
VAVKDRKPTQQLLRAVLRAAEEKDHQLTLARSVSQRGKVTQVEQDSLGVQIQPVEVVVVQQQSAQTVQVWPVAQAVPDYQTHLPAQPYSIPAAVVGFQVAATALAAQVVAAVTPQAQQTQAAADQETTQADQA